MKSSGAARSVILSTKKKIVDRGRSCTCNLQVKSPLCRPNGRSLRDGWMLIRNHFVSHHSEKKLFVDRDWLTGVEPGTCYLQIKPNAFSILSTPHDMRQVIEGRMMRRDSITKKRILSTLTGAQKGVEPAIFRSSLMLYFSTFHMIPGNLRFLHGRLEGRWQISEEGQWSGPKIFISTRPPHFHPHGRTLPLPCYLHTSILHKNVCFNTSTQWVPKMRWVDHSFSSFSININRLNRPSPVHCPRGILA